MIKTYFVPVVDLENNPLMPTTLSRARKWIATRKATPFWKGHVFCVRLNVEPSNDAKQEIAVGVDPGSKKEGFSVVSASHTYLNVQADAVTHVKKVIEIRRVMRRARRGRNTPCRPPRWNRASRRKERVAPSTKARWQWKLTLFNWLKKLFPVTNVVVEDIKARSIGRCCWDKSFSPLQVGKRWFYSQIENLTLKQGYETKALRDKFGLKKLSNKLSNDFHAHCVDAWVLAKEVIGGEINFDNRLVMLMSKIRLHRRQLHTLCPSKGGERKLYGGSISLGLKRGSLVRHNKYGVVYVGGTMGGRLSLHSIRDGVRITQRAKVEDCAFICYNNRKTM